MSLFKSNSKEPSQGKLSAEERLLEVIQNGGEATAQTSGPPRQGFYQKVLSTFKKSDSASTQTAVRGFDLACAPVRSEADDRRSDGELPVPALRTGRALRSGAGSIAAARSCGD